MSRLTVGLLTLVVVELLALTAVLVFCPTEPSDWRLPTPDLSRLDSFSRADIETLQSRFDTGHPKTLPLLAERYMALGFFTEAELCFRRVRDDQPESFDTALRHGICLDRLGQMELAIAEFRRAASLAKPNQKPPAEVCIYHSGRCFLRLENIAEAESAFRATGEFPLGRFQLAKLLARTNRTDDALAVLEPLTIAYPGELKLLLLRANIERSRGNVRRAMSLLQQSERAEDRFFVDSTIEFLGLLRAEFGLTRERAEAWKQAAAGRIPAAIERLQGSLNAEWDLKTALAVVELLLRQKDVVAAERLLDEIVGRAGLLPEGLELRGDVCLLSGRNESARESWLHSVQLRPTARVYQKLAALPTDNTKKQEFSALAVREAGIDAYRRNETPLAQNLLIQAAESLPLDSRAWFYLGLAHGAADRLTDARQAYEKCIELNPDHGPAIDALRWLSEAEETTP